jgi:hypothetical protein
MVRRFGLFRRRPQSQARSTGQARSAERIMRELNPNVQIHRDQNHLIFIEDVRDSEEDNRWYRIEYRCTQDGQHAIAYCLSNPWDRDSPCAGYAASSCHVFPDGLICLGAGEHRDVQSSSFTLSDAVSRARFWCLGFSVFKETGEFPEA